MSFYVRNKLAGSLGLRQGRIRLSPAGQPGDTKRMRPGYEEHPELLKAKKKGWVEVLSYAEYSASMSKKSPPPPAPPKVEEPVVEDPPADEDVVEVMSLEEFKTLKSGEMTDYLEELGLESPRTKPEKVGFYEAWLEEPS